MGNSCAASQKGSGYLEREEAETTAAAAAVQARPALHGGSVLGLASCGESTTLSCGDDKRICRFDWGGSSFPPLYFDGHDKAVNRIVCADTFVWSVSRDLSLRQWSVETAAPLQTIAQTHELNVSAVAARGSLSRVFTGSRDYHVKGWDVETGKCVSTFSSPRNIVTALEFEAAPASSGGLLYQASEDLCVRVWDSRSAVANVPAAHITGFVYFALCLAMHPGGTIMATGCKGFDAVGCEVKLWDLRKAAKPLAEFTGHTQDVTACKFSHDGGHLLSVSKDGSVCSWDLTLAEPSSPCLAQLSTGKMFSSLTALGEARSDELPSFVAGCFDGSLELIAHKDAASLHVKQATAPAFSQGTD